MKAKKWVTLITAGISVISLICAIVANCACVNLPLMYDISMAIFGSALLGFIMSLIEYFAERRKAMPTLLGWKKMNQCTSPRTMTSNQY